MNKALPTIGLAIALAAGAAQASPRSPLGAAFSGSVGQAAGSAVRAESRALSTTTSSSSGYRAAPTAPVTPANDLKAVTDAAGSHTVWKATPQSGVTNYATYKPNPRNPTGFDQTARVDLTGKAHHNKKLKTAIATPHVQNKQTPGGVRPVLFPNEVPKSSRK